MNLTLNGDSMKLTIDFLDERELWHLRSVSKFVLQCAEDKLKEIYISLGKPTEDLKAPLTDYIRFATRNCFSSIDLFDRHREITDIVIHNISSNRCLEILNLGLCVKLTDKTAEELSKCVFLKGLSIRNCTLSEKWRMAISNLSKLEAINLKHCTINDAWINTLCTLQGLVCINLSGCRGFNPAALESLLNLEKLKYLDLSFIRPLFSTHEGMEIRGKLKNRENLKCYYALSTDEPRSLYLRDFVSLC